MEYTFNMKYDLKAMTAMARGIRKALQQEHYRKSIIIGSLFVGIGGGILLTSGKFGYQQIIALVVLILWVLYMVFQDYIHGIWASIKMPSDMKKGTWTFREDGFFSTTEKGISGFDYDSIFAMIETEGYLILCFANNQGQVFDVAQLSEEDLAGLRKLLRKKTNLTLQNV